ncbi:MAG: amidohydrolase family protein [Planctomycetota bacterium]
MRKSKLWKRIHSEIEKIWVIDSHSHLTSEENYYKQNLSVFNMVSYFGRDIQSTSTGPLADTLPTAKTEEDKVERFLEIVRRTEAVSYFRHNIIAYQDLFGLKGDLTPKKIKKLNAAIAKKTKDPKWFRKVMKKLCRIETGLLNVPPLDLRWDKDYAIAVMRMEPFLPFLRADKPEIDKLAQEVDMPIGKVADYTAALARLMQKARDLGAVGIKLAHAYQRTLAHTRPSEQEADAIFQKVLRGERPPAGEEKALQDHIVFFLADAAGQMDLVFQIHTGVQNNWGHIPDSDPLHLLNLLREFPKTRFDIFHAGYPYSREMGMLGKHYPNVWANMCWMYPITMEGSRQTLDEWIDLIPGYRILGFGSDVPYPENVFAHLKMARACITDVLAKKVEQDFITEDIAVRLAKQMLRNNLIALFKLDERFGIRKME